MKAVKLSDLIDSENAVFYYLICGSNFKQAQLLNQVNTYRSLSVMLSSDGRSKKLRPVLDERHLSRDSLVRKLKKTNPIFPVKYYHNRPALPARRRNHAQQSALNN